MDPCACLVFAKAPRPGQCKTRLATAVGEEAAATLARALLRDTVRGLSAHPGLAVIVSTTDPTVDHGVEAPLWDQGGGELGARLERGFRRALGDFDRAIAVGADSPGLPDGHLVALRAALAHGAAIGPTEDGGFWGLGLRSAPEGLLLGLPWSTSRTAAATVDRLRAHDVALRWAPPWWDVDHPADLGRLRREIPRERAPATHAVLDGLGWP